MEMNNDRTNNTGTNEPRSTDQQKDQVNQVIVTDDLTKERLYDSHHIIDDKENHSPKRPDQESDSGESPDHLEEQACTANSGSDQKLTVLRKSAYRSPLIELASGAGLSIIFAGPRAGKSLLMHNVLSSSLSSKKSLMRKFLKVDEPTEYLDYISDFNELYDSVDVVSIQPGVKVSSETAWKELSQLVFQDVDEFDHTQNALTDKELIYSKISTDLQPRKLAATVYLDSLSSFLFLKGNSGTATGGLDNSAQFYLTHLNNEAIRRGVRIIAIVNPGLSEENRFKSAILGRTQSVLSPVSGPIPTHNSATVGTRYELEVVRDRFFGNMSNESKENYYKYLGVSGHIDIESPAIRRNSNISSFFS